MRNSYIGIVDRTGVNITAAYVDKGYRGHDYQGDATIHISGSNLRKLLGAIASTLFRCMWSRLTTAQRARTDRSTRFLTA